MEQTFKTEVLDIIPKDTSIQEIIKVFKQEILEYDLEDILQLKRMMKVLESGLDSDEIKTYILNKIKENAVDNKLPFKDIECQVESRITINYSSFKDKTWELYNEQIKNLKKLKDSREKELKEIAGPDNKTETEFVKVIIKKIKEE